MQLHAWAVCPNCLAPYNQSSCPTCGEEEASRPPARALPLPPPEKGESPAGPLERPTPSGAAVGGVTLGALGLVPILGLAFCVLGVILSLAALRSLHRQGRPTWIAYLGLGVSLTTSVPGIFLWWWLQAASAAW
jgi:hypothetical protein